MLRRNLTLAIFFLPLAAAPHARAQTAYFNDYTDTIQVAGQTQIGSTCTYEAIIRFPADVGAGGMFFNEWSPFAEDKLVFLAFSPVEPSVLVTYNYPAQGGTLNGTATIVADIWHHLAFVYDGADERLYFDGSLLASRPIAFEVGNGNGQAHVGAIHRDGTISASFIGYVESMRVSDVARYSGDTFAPPLGDLSSDSNTLLLYNFNEPAGSATIQDESPLARTGTLGIGFVGATSPQLGAVGVATERDADFPQANTLLAAFPNPFDSEVTIPYELSQGGHVRLAVYNAIGQDVAVLVDAESPAGRHDAVFDGRGSASGIYFVRMTVDGGFTQTRRVAFLE